MPKKSKQDELDPEEQAVLEWCIEVEKGCINRGATQQEAQQFIEDEIEWLTDLFYDGLSPDEAVNEVMN